MFRYENRPRCCSFGRLPTCTIPTLLPLSNKLGNTRKRSVQKQSVLKTFVAWTWIGRGRDAGIRARDAFALSLACCTFQPATDST